MKIEGTAMLPKLKDGDRVFVSRYIKDLERGEIICFYYPKDESRIFFKRVIALPGETIAILKGEVIINNKKLRNRT